jgi:hypothetical protein
LQSPFYACMACLLTSNTEFVNYYCRVSEFDLSQIEKNLNELIFSQNSSCAGKGEQLAKFRAGFVRVMTLKFSITKSSEMIYFTMLVHSITLKIIELDVQGFGSFLFCLCDSY